MSPLLRRDVRHDVIHAASTTQLLVAGLRTLHTDTASHRMLDGVERCAHDITAMMLDTPDERVPEVLDLAPLAVRAGQNTELTFRGKVEVVAERAMVRASSTDVARMLNNLLENAVWAAMPNGTVQLSVTSEETRCVIRVADSGPGFLDRANRNGIGIAVVAAIAVRLEGELTLGSSSLGGALISISLPRVEDAEIPSRAGSEPAP